MTLLVKNVNLLFFVLRNMYVLLGIVFSRNTFRGHFYGARQEEKNYVFCGNSDVELLVIHL